MEVEELQANPPLNNVDLEALVEELRMLTQKAKRVNFFTIGWWSSNYYGWNMLLQKWRC
jgi:hypothetical protein